MAEDRPDRDDQRTAAEIAAGVELDSAEAAKFRAEAAKYAAEAAAASETARKEAIAADKAQIDLDREIYKRDLELAADQFHHVYVFDKDVNEGSVKACIGQLAQWTRRP